MLDRVAVDDGEAWPADDQTARTILGQDSGTRPKRKAQPSGYGRGDPPGGLIEPSVGREPDRAVPVLVDAGDDCLRQTEPSR